VPDCGEEGGTGENFVDGPEEGWGEVRVGVAEVRLHFVGVFFRDPCLSKNSLSFADYGGDVVGDVLEVFPERVEHRGASAVASA